MDHLIHLTFGTSAAIGLLGYAVVFFGLILLMLVVILLGAIMKRAARPKRSAAPDPALPAEAPAAGAAQPRQPGAPQTDEPELFDTDPRDAAMVMAIVAYQLGKPLEELHFKSIREIR